jgi:hypothetical protein
MPPGSKSVSIGFSAKGPDGLEEMRQPLRIIPQAMRKSSHAQIPLRYVLAFSAVTNTTIRPFLAKKGHSPEEVERMHQSWIKAVTLQITLWSRAYAPENW